MVVEHGLLDLGPRQEHPAGVPEPDLLANLDHLLCEAVIIMLLLCCCYYTAVIILVLYTGVIILLLLYCCYYIEIQGTTPNFCPINLGILVSGMGQLQGVFGTQISQLNKKLKTCNWKSLDI